MLSFIVPTYNEKENIPSVLSAIRALGLQDDYEIIFIDDSSPDGTGDIIKQEASRDSRIRLISRPAKQGLSSAYFRGLGEGKGEILITLEADFERGIGYVPQMLEKMQNENLDGVFQSRYAPGAKSKIYLLKRIGSRILNRLAVIYLKLPTTDPFLGYRAMKRESFEKFKDRVTFFQHPEFFAQISYLSARTGAKIGEIPIIFEPRQFGKSKNTLFKPTWSFLKNLPKIKQSA